ncbi:MAG: sterol desaturase family protein, partial [Myxococcota bacterium]
MNASSSTTMGYILFAIPFFVITMALEAWVWHRRRPGPSPSETAPVRGERGRYELGDTAVSLSMGLANMAIAAGFKVASFGLFLWAYEHRVWTVPNVWWAWPLLILGEDFCYYWFHRLHHEVRFLWAAHVNHHSSRRYNLSTALRQSWTTPFTGPLFWVPLGLVGFHPEMVVVAKTISLLYQYWLHTEVITRLGPLAWVLNTPSHHRVHHGRNPQYLDKNYGGIFIIYDRLFGTFEPEAAPVDYGLTKNLNSRNPLVVAFHEWWAMAVDAIRAPGL